MKAFPCKAYVQDKTGVVGISEHAGMDLRDYFANQAPVYLEDAFESLQRLTKTTLTEKHDYEVFKELARLNYVYADAMMEARKK